MQSDIVQRLLAASQGMRSHYKVGAVELIPTHTMDEAAAEITRMTEALRAAEADLRRCFKGETHAVRNERVMQKIHEYTEAALKEQPHADA